MYCGSTCDAHTSLRSSDGTRTYYQIKAKEHDYHPTSAVLRKYHLPSSNFLISSFVSSDSLRPFAAQALYDELQRKESLMLTTKLLTTKEGTPSRTKEIGKDFCPIKSINSDIMRSKSQFLLFLWGLSLSGAFTLSGPTASGHYDVVESRLQKRSGALFMSEDNGIVEGMPRPRGRPTFKPKKNNGHYPSQIYRLGDGHTLQYNEYYLENNNDVIVCKCRYCSAL
jgi:hypothetical protein